MTKTILASFALLAAIGCEGLPAGDMKSPEYWSDVMLEKHADELEFGELEPGPERLDEPRTVLLITGVTIKAEWFDQIFARLERDGFRPVVYEPPELLSGSLFQATRDLADVVARVRAESGQDKIDILAECTGGVIARHYLQSLGGDQYVERLVTFVSPHHGIDKAPLGAAFVGWPALYDLSPGSEFLNAVNGESLPANVRVTSIFTCDDEYIRPYETAIVEGANNIELCGDEFVGHFQTFYDPEIYLIMHAALVEGLVDADPNTDPDPNQPDEQIDPIAEDDASASGCSAAPGSSKWTGLWLLGAVMLVIRRRRGTPRVES